MRKNLLIVFRVCFLFGSKVSQESLGKTMGVTNLIIACVFFYVCVTTIIIFLDRPLHDFGSAHCVEEGYVGIRRMQEYSKLLRYFSISFSYLHSSTSLRAFGVNGYFDIGRRQNPVAKQ